MVAHVAHAYGARKALDDVSLVVPRGRFVALLGPNGAGKSTLVSLISGLFHARVGSVAIAGHDIRRRSTAALARLGIVFQSRTLDLDLSVAGNLAHHAALHGMAQGEGRARAEALLARFDFPTVPVIRSALPAANSGGSRSPARCCTRPTSWCSTSRRSASIRPRAPI